MTELDRILDDTRAEVARREQERPLGELERELVSLERDRRPFAEAIGGDEISLIAEFKRSSPSAGEIRPGADVAEIVSAYERGGAHALSVLTERKSFGGSLADLKTARAASSLPILRKDFVVSHYQLLEAAVGVADAVLLIVAALDDTALAAFHETARALDLDALVEVHDEDELERALKVGADLIGVNNRDLRDLSVDLAVTLDLLPEVPAGTTIVAESGISTREQLEQLEDVGVDAVLVGHRLLRVEEPERAVRELLPETHDGERL